MTYICSFTLDMQKTIVYIYSVIIYFHMVYIENIGEKKMFHYAMYDFANYILNVLQNMYTHLSDITPYDFEQSRDVFHKEIK